MNKAKRILSVLLIAGAILAAGCGTQAPKAPETAPEPIATPEPTPEPTPAPLTGLEAGESVIMNGTQLQSGSVILDGTVCVRLSEAIAALNAESVRDGDELKFTWRGKPVTLELHKTACTYGDRQAELETPVFVFEGAEYVPAESFCNALDIGLFRDEENAVLYCTPGAGSWELPEGRTVPVLMYHSMSKNWNGEEALVVRPDQFRLQMEMFTEEGYQFIWFEDLSELDKYDKPIILTFDDGYRDNFTELLPILREFNAKATYFIIAGTLEKPHGKYLSEEDITECISTGLIDIQSHTVNHNFLSYKNAEDLAFELSESKLILTRLTGKEPFVLSYPCGETNERVYTATPEYYRFAVKMRGELWVTGENPIEIYRVPVYKGVSVELLKGWLDGTYRLC